MTTALGPVAQTGVVSTQLERVQNSVPTTPEAPQPREAEAPPPPPPPPPESGRGTTVDTTA